MELGKDRDVDRSFSLHRRKQFVRVVHVAQTNAASQANVPTDVFDDAHAKQGGPGAFTTNSGDKTLIKNRLLIREAKCFHLVGWESENKIAVFVRPNAGK
jgi:hypothetical protein